MGMDITMGMVMGMASRSEEGGWIRLFWLD